MAIVNTLIVKGVARFLTDAYMSTIRSGIWNGNTIEVGYGGTGVTSAKGDQYTPVFLSSSGIAPCSVEIPHTTKNFTINGVTYAVFTNSAGAAPTIVAPTALAGTGGYILATNSGKTGLEWVAKPTGNVATSAVVASSATGTTQITAAQTDPFYNLLEGGAVARSIQFKHGDNMTISSTTGGVITFTASNTWRNIYVGGTAKVTNGIDTKALNFAATGNLSVAYLAPGTSSGQSGSADYFTIQINAAANAVGVAGYVAAPTKAANPNQVWMTNADGVPAWRNAVASAVLADAANSTTQLTAEQTNPFYNLLFGGSVAHSVQFVAGEGMAVGTTDGSDIRITNSAPVYYIKGNADATAGTWTGTDSRISAYYEGLTVIFVPQKAGASTTTLNINGLGAKTCYFTPSSKLTTHYAVGTPIMLTYYADTWRTADYDSNSDTWRGVYTNGTSRIGTATNTKAINFTATGNLSVDYLAATAAASGSTNYFTIRINAAANAVDTAGYVAAPTAADNPNQVWMTNSNGEPAWRTVNISNAAQQLFSGAKTLAVNSWQTIAAVNTLEAGTYAISISSGTLYASGVFTSCAGSDVIVDEIVLHVANSTSGQTWRPYARISGNNLEMSSNESTGTSRTYTVKILKLI